MVWCDNIDYDIMLDTLKGIPFSEEYSQSLNTLILEMLHAYDCSNSTREDILPFYTSFICSATYELFSQKHCFVIEPPVGRGAVSVLSRPWGRT